MLLSHNENIIEDLDSKRDIFDTVERKERT